MSEEGQLRWLDSDTVLLIRQIDECEGELTAEELPCARGMRPRRLREFIAGRCAARLALSTMGESSATIPVGAAGEPLWPAGFVGSISHTTTHVAVLTSLRTRFASVGIDLDDDRPLGEPAAADLMMEEEIQLVQEVGWVRGRSQALNAVFCAKEAIFKCQYPLSGVRDLGFDEVRLFHSDRPGILAVGPQSQRPGIGTSLGAISMRFLIIQSLRVALAFAEKVG